MNGRQPKAKMQDNEEEGEGNTDGCTPPRSSSPRCSGFSDALTRSRLPSCSRTCGDPRFQKDFHDDDLSFHFFLFFSEKFSSSLMKKEGARELNKAKRLFAEGKSKKSPTTHKKGRTRWLRWRKIGGSTRSFRIDSN